MTLSYEKPKVKLIGNDGNAFFILGQVKKAMKKAGASEDELVQYVQEATTGDYNHLLQVSMEYIDIY